MLPSVTERARITLPSVALDWSNSTIDPTLYTLGYSSYTVRANVSVDWRLIIEDGALNELANVDYGSTVLSYVANAGRPGGKRFLGDSETLTPSTSTVIINRAGNEIDNRKITFFLRAVPTVQTGTGSVAGDLL
jgi:hypothetical protein